METKALKKQLGAAIAMVLVAAIALGAATFAWFVNNNAVTATGANVSTSSAVPNLYITSTGKTTDGMKAADINPGKLYPVSTNDAINFYETKHWTSGAGNHAVADEYQDAIVRETGKTVYTDYTFTLGVTNGSMDVYFDSSTSATTLKANPETKMGTAGRFAISFDNGATWKLFKVPGTATNNGYYTDSAAETATQGDYWVKKVDDKLKAVAVPAAADGGYMDFSSYSGSIDAQGQAVKGTNKLTTITSNKEVKVIVRVWYEGCDKDCVSENAQNGIASAITGNLGFVGVQTA